jgi:hypothetical protein
MARFGFVVLVLWEAIIVGGVVFGPSMDILVYLRLLLVGGIGIPVAAWVCWRAVLWIVRGFVRDVPAP